MQLSYAQNMEDMVLQRLFADQPEGFYIDVGAGHAVADNVTFLFYEKGWRGVVVEPNARLAQAYRNVRPRDILVQALCGRAEGTADFFEAGAFHGLSTTVASNAATAAEKGVGMEKKQIRMTTLAALCQRHAEGGIDFLKVDVEGAEAEVLAGNDWSRFRPKVVVLEAVAPWSMADASADFEPMLVKAGYGFAFFDNLNRWYVAEEAAALKPRFPTGPLDWGSVKHLGEYGRAEADSSHPDHALAVQLDPKILSDLNTLSASALRELMPAGVNPSREAVRAQLARIASMHDGGYVI